jgi:ribosome maturation factor RimP
LTERHGACYAPITFFEFLRKVGASGPTFSFFGAMSAYLQGIVERVRELAEPLLAHQGYELVDLEYLREGPRWVLRLFIDKPGGISLDDCQDVSRNLSAALDVEDFIENTYALEVSSPGIERPLRKPEHFERFSGELAVVKTFAPVGVPPRKNFKGRILGLEGPELRLETDGAEYRIPLDRIARAHLAFDFESMKHGRPG